ncbi:hypothetical protein KBD08_00095 [Candidatus Babeliales bacterium]|nr:hypothetical protein [Candidatus Babeliales bacterium]
MCTLCTNIIAPWYQDEPKKLFAGSIEFPFKMDCDLCVFYKGEKLLLEKNAATPLFEFSFVDSKNTQTLYFIITNGLTCCTEKANTLCFLEIAPNQQYICYKLEATREINNNNILLTWNASEHLLHKNQIPVNSLVFLFDPSLIEGLKIDPWKPENVFRTLPSITISHQATHSQLQRAMTLARLAALDIDALHAKKLTNYQNPTSAILTVLQ